MEVTLAAQEPVRSLYGELLEHQLKEELRHFCQMQVTVLEMNQLQQRANPVVRWVTPEEFDDLGRAAEQMGFASLQDLFDFLENETESPSPGARNAAKAGSQPPAMPGRQGAPICQAPRERTNTGEEVM